MESPDDERIKIGKTTINLADEHGYEYVAEFYINDEGMTDIRFNPIKPELEPTIMSEPEKVKLIESKIYEGCTISSKFKVKDFRIYNYLLMSETKVGLNMIWNGECINVAYHCTDDKVITMESLLEKYQLIGQNILIEKFSSGTVLEHSQYSPKFLYASPDCVIVLGGVNRVKVNIDGEVSNVPCFENIYFYVRTQSAFNDVVKELKEMEVDMVKVNSYDYPVGLMIQTMTGLEVKTYTIEKTYNVDIKNHYNDDFIEFDQSLKHSLETTQSGLFLLHGLPGTGKTSYIKYLASHYKHKRNFIFLPPMFADGLSSPKLVSTMLSHRNSVLVIEDAENCLRPRSTGQNNNAVSNILNITDGIMGDAIQCHVICTINSGLDDIDDALKRSGRNKGVYKFEKLAASKASKILGKKVEHDMTLNEIFHGSEVAGSGTFAKRKMGFGN